LRIKSSAMLGSADSDCHDIPPNRIEVTWFDLHYATAALQIAARS